MKLLNNKTNFLLGSSVNFYCTYIITFIVSVIILRETNNLKLMGLLNALVFVVFILISFISIFFIDKLNKRLVLILSNLVSGLLCIISYFIFNDNFSFIVILILVLLLKVLSTIYSISIKSSITLFFDNSEVIGINKLFYVLKRLFNIVTPLIAGFLIIYINAYIIILINGILYIVSALIYYLLESKIYTNEINQTKDSSIKSIIKVLKKDIHMTGLIVLASVSNFFLAGVNLLIPYITLKILDNNLYLSILLSLEASGAILAPILLNYINSIKFIKNNLYILFILGALVLVFAIPNIYILGVIIFLYSFIQSSFNINFLTYIQTNVDKSNIGKIFSFINLFSGLMIPLGSIVLSYLDYFKGYSLVVLGLMFTIFIISFISIWKYLLIDSKSIK